VDLAGASLIPLSIGLSVSALTLFGRYGFWLRAGARLPCARSPASPPSWRRAPGARL